MLQTKLRHNVLAYGISGARWIIGDNFTVRGSMAISEIELFVIDGEGRSSTSIANFEISIFDGDPRSGTPNQLIPGAGRGANIIGKPGFAVATQFTGTYRVTDQDPKQTRHPILSLRIKLTTALQLNTGVYWFGFRGQPVSTSPGNYLTLPLTTTNFARTGDAIQNYSGTWHTVRSPWHSLPGFGFRQGLPFRFYGTASRAPGGNLSLGGGCSNAIYDVTGAATSGGYFRGVLTGAVGTGVILVGLGDPNMSLPGCGCVLRVRPDAILPTQTLMVTIPLDPTINGVDVFTQGANIGLGSTCSSGFDLTKAYRFRLW